MTQKTTDNPDDGIQGEDEAVIQGGRATILDGNEDLDESEDKPEGKESTGDEERLYAGNFKTPEDLEKAYKELQAEYTRTRQAQKQGESGGSEDDTQRQQGGDTGNNDVAEMRREMAELRADREWDKLKRKYGDDIQEKVRAYFDRLPKEDQADLNTMAGARMIADIVTKDGDTSRRGSQSSGSPQSHSGAGKSTLTRAKIAAMSAEEYERRQPEIRRFYEQNYGS